MPDTPGKRVAKLREERGWKQTKLAEKAGISVTYLSEVENGKRSMGSDVLLRVADALGVSLDYIVKGTVTVPPPDKPLTIPIELERAAEEHNWSIRTIQDLIKAKEIVVARRGEDRKAVSPEKTFSKEDWINLYDRLFSDEYFK